MNNYKFMLQTCWGALLVTVCIVQSAFHVASAAQDLPECKFPAVYAFGDSLTDTGNSIAAFPDQFANAELDPHGVLFPGHAADRYTDGKLLIDFLGTYAAPSLESREVDSSIDICT
jgi:hypothetical protein